MRFGCLSIALVFFTLFAVPLSVAQEEGPGGDPECIIYFAPSPDFSVVRVRADLILSLEERDALAAEIDANQDGVLNRTEVAAYEAAAARVLLKGDAALGDKRLAMDGAEAESTTFLKKLTHWEGPVEIARNGTVTEMRVYDFPRASSNPQESHVLSVGAYGAPAQIPPRPVIETVVMQAPQGWVVWSVTNSTPPPADPQAPPATPDYLPRSGGAQYQARQVELRGNDTANGYHVLFAREGTDPFGVRGDDGILPSPSPGFIAVLAAVVVAVGAFGGWKAGQNRR